MVEPRPRQGKIIFEYTFYPLAIINLATSKVIIIVAPYFHNNYDETRFIVINKDSSCIADNKSIFIENIDLCKLNFL